MPPKKKSSKTKIGTYKPKKRKSISPIQTNEIDSAVKVKQQGSNEQGEQKTEQKSNQTTGQWSLCSVSPEIEQQKKRFHALSPECYQFRPFIDNQNNLANMAMNFPQMPFAGQMGMQSPPPFNSQYNNPPLGSSMFNTQSPPPPWATEIMEDIKTIKKSMAKIDSIEKMVNTITTKVNKLETNVKTIDTRVTETEKSNQFLSDKFEDAKKQLKHADTELKKLSTRCNEFEEEVEKLKTQNENLEAKTNDLEFRSLRENLLFHGIAETPNENCETLVQQFVTEKLEIAHNIIIDRAHRLGKPRGKTRPIVVKFHQYTDRELIRTKAAEKSEMLKSIHQGVGVQQTKAVLNKRKNLSTAYDREKAAGKTVKWVGAKLMVREGNTGDFHEVKE